VLVSAVGVASARAGRGGGGGWCWCGVGRTGIAIVESRYTLIVQGAVEEEEGG
jgi:hypothetical protein